MIVQHRLQVAATCPVDEDTLDIYEVTVTVIDRTLPVESILEAAKKVARAPIFQEDLTRELALALNARVQTVGSHSGVRTTCEHDPAGAG